MAAQPRRGEEEGAIYLVADDGSKTRLLPTAKSGDKTRIKSETKPGTVAYFLQKHGTRPKPKAKSKSTASPGMVRIRILLLMSLRS